MERAVLVTGASSGIGAASALALAERGFTVFAGVRRRSDGAGLAPSRERIRTLELDVTDAAQIESATRSIAACALPLHAVVNNAGIAVPGPLEMLRLEEIRHQYEVNVFGALAVTKAFLEPLRAAHGRVIFVGSIGGRLSVPALAAYNSSKAALRFLADALRMELKSSGIEVALVEPGGVKTPIWSKGRAWKDELLARAGTEAATRYHAMTERLVKISSSEERNGLAPEVVADVVLHAVCAHKPRARYVLGRRARIQAIVSLLPAELREAIVMRLMGISSGE